MTLIWAFTYIGDPYVAFTTTNNNFAAIAASISRSAKCTVQINRTLQGAGKVKNERYVPRAWNLERVYDRDLYVCPAVPFRRS